MGRLVDIIQQTMQQFAVEAKQDDITLIFEHSAEFPDLDIAQHVVSHDVTHLLNHLISFTPRHGQIHLALTIDENQQHLLAISNTGIDLHVYTGVLKNLLLPTRISKSGENSTRFEIQLVTGTNGSAIGNSQPIDTSENNFYLEIQQRLRSHFNRTENLLATLKSNPVETAFFTKVNRLIYDNLSNVQFDVNMLAGLLNMSRTQLFRKLKPIIKQSASGYIRSLRLQKAKELLETTEHRVSEVAYITGFETPSNFTKVFVKTFGIKPSDISRHRPAETNEQENAT